MVLATAGHATIEWDIQRTLNLKTAPRDVAVSLNGRWIYVLSGEGSILIYSPAGGLEDDMGAGELFEHALNFTTFVVTEGQSPRDETLTVRGNKLRSRIVGFKEALERNRRLGE